MKRFWLASPLLALAILGATTDVAAAATGPATHRNTNSATAPVVLTNPASVTVAPWTFVTMSSTASGTPAPSQQWQVSSDGGASFSNVSSFGSTLMFFAQPHQNGWQLRSVFTNQAGTATSTVATLSVVSRTPAPTPTPAPAPSPNPSPGPIPAPGSTQSSNWSGFSSAGGVFSSVSGSFKVPTAQCAPGANSVTAIWVGIDGATSNTVEQDGVQVNCANGVPQYGAWYEMFGDNAVNNGYSVDISPTTYPVAAGDSITASVSFANQIWTLSLINKTAGWTFATKVANGTPPPAQSSAEWIVERPELCNGSCSFAALTPTAAITFTEVHAVSSTASGTLKAFTSTAMTMTSATKALATPSAASTDGSSFVVTLN